MSAAAAPALEPMSLEAARRWIGRRLVLVKPLLGFEAGTPCVVMCVVDFGDGLLLWVSTDDKRSLDVDQVSWKELEEYFEPLPAGVAPDSAGSRAGERNQEQVTLNRRSLMEEVLTDSRAAIDRSRRS